MSAVPFDRTEQLGFDEIWDLSMFRKYEYVENIQISLKSDKNNEYITWRRRYIYDNISPNSP